MYHAEKLPETNLVFVISDAKLTCSSCKSKKLIQDEQQCILAEAPDRASRAQQSREVWSALATSDVRQMGREMSPSASFQTDS